MSEKFTKGIWEIEERSAHFGSYSMYGFSIQTKAHRICMCQTDDDRNIPQMKANAALIAAAPELYECVCDALTDLEMSEGMRAHFEKVLKKVRGEE